MEHPERYSKCINYELLYWERVIRERKKCYIYIMKFVLIEFIPILLLFFLVSYTDIFIKLSNTVLGRLFAVVIILFYTSFDVIHGLFACAIIILFYQSDIVENMLNHEEHMDGFTSIEVEDLFTKTKNISPEELQSEKNSEKRCEKSYVSQYEVSNLSNPSSESVKTEFRKSYCQKGHLVNKGQKVRVDMAEHVFPEVSFPNEKCNICDPTCNFSVIEKQINTAMSSKSSR